MLWISIHRKTTLRCPKGDSSEAQWYRHGPRPLFMSASSAISTLTIRRRPTPVQVTSPSHKSKSTKKCSRACLSLSSKVFRSSQFRPILGKEERDGHNTGYHLGLGSSSPSNYRIGVSEHRRRKHELWVSNQHVCHGMATLAVIGNHPGQSQFN